VTELVVYLLHLLILTSQLRSSNNKNLWCWCLCCWWLWIPTI